MGKNPCNMSVEECKIVMKWKCCFNLFLHLVEKSAKSEKASNPGPQFTSGVIMKITDNKPLPGRKLIKVQYTSNQLSSLSVFGRNNTLLSSFVRVCAGCSVQSITSGVRRHLGGRRWGSHPLSHPRRSKSCERRQSRATERAQLETRDSVRYDYWNYLREDMFSS